VILLDTSVLIDSFTADQRAAPALRRLLERGERLVFPALVLYEWLRGPRLPEEIALLEELIPREFIIPFEAEDAALSARLYRAVKRPRGREIDLAIAACAINRNVPLWTTNRADFADIPGLKLYSV
jgi:predicted nucleic acid-binding protein